MHTQTGESLSHYRIERELGRGGMAMVYLAEDTKHGRQVAIKVMHPEMAEEIGHDRFLREIEIAARLTHPHILPLHDSGVADGQLYYVMPYIAGESLRARMNREKRLPIDEALRLTREIASALGYAHRQGLIHRDIKPENVLLSDGITLVADFGIARGSITGARSSEAAREAATMAGEVIGTPRYMAPEQAVGSDVDGRTDQYALSCVLYEMLAGESPFTEPTMDGLIRQHLSMEPRPVTEHRASVPSSISDVIMRGLAKAPADRYANMAQFAEALASAGMGGSTHLTSRQVAGTATPNNLPPPRTHFIGREKELAECARLLGDTRLLTLTGIGGCGKTRITLRLAENLLGAYPDGVWFVDLAPLNDAGSVVSTAATVLGVREEHGTPLIDRLTRHVNVGRVLIVLDNCEHVLAAAGDLAEALLATSTDLKLVVTSREGLGVAGEQTFSVRSLPVPAQGKGTDFNSIESSDAVRLFVDRARLVEPRFTLDVTNAPVISEICHRLDGIPLAIELAAARVKVLTVEQIREKLDDRFRLLTGGIKTALARHQTLRATIQWSYDHLSEEEQRLFRVLAVFAGGWTLSGATAVLGADADEFEVLDTITHLVDKSLVGMVREGGEGRYRMLETVRQYAQERLKDTGEGDEARTRHLSFYLALAEEAEPMLRGPEQGAWMSRLDRERENLLLAHAWCDRAEGGAGKGLRLVHAVQGYWLHFSHLEQGYRVTLEALERAGTKERSLARSGGLYAAGVLGLFTGRYDEAKGYLEECLSIAREVGNKGRASGALRLLGMVAHSQGDRAKARKYSEEGLALARDLGDKHKISLGLNSLAELDRAEGDLESAEPLYEETLSLHRELRDHLNIALNLVNLAMVSIGRGAGLRSRDMLLEALGIAEEMDAKDVGQFVMDAAAGLGASLGDWRAAARFHGASLARMELTGFHREAPDEAFIVPLIGRARSELGEAAFAAAESAGRALSYEAAVSEMRQWLAAEVPA